MLSKVKAALNAAAVVLLSPEFRPFEVKLARAVAVAVLGALGVKYGVKVA